ncbi:helix-loop-helix DNA-binding domain-containing protein [Colletotrichum tamarilloi]|uniref:Helix-loop-helix DNA-binding domain-containing protein n=1 Tax=Colletotrichum tamarilloi TaxID=1209934 RepID=A0ABQ9R8L8_9PEZI|nr:helix-loop-helix DNA-binding domain-containing protein [Colletotrichum tamarilloi]KAK1497553.1 helix-loop-helix DNA-binding domain-containing protein [Colletotrichum tamarilloi]
MPRPTLLPTPASSTDIKGQDGSKDLASLQLSFELPPPAIVQDASRVSPKDTRRTSPANTNSFQPISPPHVNANKPYPVQPSETVKSRRRSSAAQKTAAAASNESFALPPPPTRSRKIIQMKPRAQQQNEAEAEAEAKAKDKDAPSAAAGAKSGAAGPGKAGSAAANGSSSSSASTAQGKKKAPSATSAAGRKIARKTAHSLIERRRRSKMNEEFAVLKGMIPACTGEMHKLAILQASIEYVRYLEDCVSKLKAQRDASEARSPAESGLQTPSGGGSRAEPWGQIPQFVPRYQEDPDDVEMTDSEAPSPTFPPTQQQQQQLYPQQQQQQQLPHTRSQQPSVSPALLPQDSRHRHDSYSSVSTDHPRHNSYSYSTSTTTSPAFGPQAYGGGYGSLSALTSPALAPQRDRDLDHEATAALLMLNSDRRGTVGEASGSGAGAGGIVNPTRGAGRGMSVRDLLST